MIIEQNCRKGVVGREPVQGGAKNGVNKTETRAPIGAWEVKHGRPTDMMVNREASFLISVIRS